jgi:N6-adenosine-specific RNA methylase IME4
VSSNARTFTNAKDCGAEVFSHLRAFSLDHEYPTQSQDWIARLPVHQLAAKDSVLFLWAVSPQLPEAIQVMNSWGFKYVMGDVPRIELFARDYPEGWDVWGNEVRSSVPLLTTQ